MSLIIVRQCSTDTYHRGLATVSASSTRNCCRSRTSRPDSSRYWTTMSAVGYADLESGEAPRLCGCSPTVIGEL
jgi:hypothetical protein